VDAPKIVARTLSTPVAVGPTRRLLQYHPQSDRHSKVACWGVLFDLIQNSAAMRQHIADGKVGFGINRQLWDYTHHKKKNLDLVVCRPGTLPPKARRPYTLPTLATKWGVDLSPAEQTTLGNLPPMIEQPAGAVLIALEAKAAMTEHVKALPRLYDELNSSHAIVHGNSSQALSIGFVMVNAADRFVSPERQAAGSPIVWNHHTQPHAAERAVELVGSLPRRSGTIGNGYDGLGIVVVKLANDGSPMTLVSKLPAPAVGTPYHYDSMLMRMATEYDTRFATI
jgi:hypothetical protein